MGKTAEEGGLNRQKLRELVTGPHDFVQTSPCGAGQRHPHGLVGHVWRIKTPDTINMGNSGMKGQLKSGDLALCIRHNGDCFQDYILMRETGEGMVPIAGTKFGAYGIGDAEIYHRSYLP